MHIHCVKFGKHVKRLLRISYREAGRVRKYTLANLTNFDQAALSAIEDAVNFRRYCRDIDLRRHIDMQIFNILSENTDPKRRWRLIGRPSSVRSIWC